MKIFFWLSKQIKRLCDIKDNKIIEKAKKYNLIIIKSFILFK